MVLPLGLPKTAKNQPIMVELKNGETYNGHLVNCDNWMNINLREVICTSRDGDHFWKMPECYIRGSTIKYLRIPDEVIDMVKEESQKGRGRGGGGNSLTLVATGSDQRCKNLLPQKSLGKCLE